MAFSDFNRIEAALYANVKRTRRENPPCGHRLACNACAQFASHAKRHSNTQRLHTHLSSLGLAGERTGGASPMVGFVDFTSVLGHDDFLSNDQITAPQPAKKAGQNISRFDG